MANSNIEPPHTHNFVEYKDMDYPNGVEKCTDCGLFKHDLPELLKQEKEGVEGAISSCMLRQYAQRDRAK